MRVWYGGQEIELRGDAKCVCGHDASVHCHETIAGEVIAGADEKSWCASCDCGLFRWVGLEWDGYKKTGERQVARWGDEWIVCDDDALCMCGQKRPLHDPQLMSLACDDFRWVMSRDEKRQRDLGLRLTERDIKMLRAGYKMGFGATTREVNFESAGDALRGESVGTRIARVGAMVEKMFRAAMDSMTTEDGT